MSNRGASPADLIRHNDWSRLDPPALAGWTPSLPVTALLVAGADRSAVELSRAALGRQDYPADLLDVVVVDQGAGFTGAVAAARGRVLVRVEAGTVCHPATVSALVRWQHADPRVVSLAATGHRLHDAVDPARLADPAGDFDQILGSAPGDPALPATLGATHELRTADHLVFRAVTGTVFAFDRELLSGGDDPYAGADVEVGYRLAQAGAVFVPEPAARVWAPAPAGGEQAARVRRATLAGLVPYPRSDRPAGGRSWGVPLVTAVVPATGRYELVRACVDRLLGSDETDLRVLLVGDWTGSGTDDERLLAAEYRHECRVRLVADDPGTGFPSPYLLRVPAELGVGPATVGRLVAVAEKWRTGLVRVLPAGASSPGRAVELWTTAALARALRAGVAADGLPEAVAGTHGQRWETGSEYDVTDLTGQPPAQLEPRRPAAAGAGRRSETVPVGGARSLVKATAFVTRRYARAARRRIVRR